MRTHIALCLSLSLLSALAGCYTSHASYDQHTISSTSATGQVAGRPTLGQPIPVPGQPTVLVPFAVESEKGLFEKDDPYLRGGVQQQRLSYLTSVETPRSYTSGSVRWHNAIIHDPKTGEEWPILDRRGIIGQWEVFGKPAKQDQPFVSRAILFIAVLDDTNHDGLLDDRDARVAILTDADGRHPRIVSPANAQVWDASYDAEHDTIFLRVATDSNGDGRFTFEDEALPYALAADATTPAKPVITAATLDRVKQWLTDKERGMNHDHVGAGR
jgi:hypothetical protein